jgi:hypothetical protein
MPSRDRKDKHVAVAMICTQRLAETIHQGYYDIVSRPGGDIFYKRPGPRRDGPGEIVGMAVLPLKYAESIEALIGYAKSQAEQARSLNGFNSLMQETTEHVRLVKEHWERHKKEDHERRGEPPPCWDWGVGMNPSMEEHYLPTFQQALFASRELDGEEQALISVIEYPTPPTYKNLDCEGLVAHGTMLNSEVDKHVEGAISCARREIFEEAAIYVPREFFYASSAPDDPKRAPDTGLPPGLLFTHGPYTLPTKKRCR